MIWVKATKAKFEEHGQSITTERKLKKNAALTAKDGGEFLKHFDLTCPDVEDFFLKIRKDKSVQLFKHDDMLRQVIALEPLEPGEEPPYIPPLPEEESIL